MVLQQEFNIMETKTIQIPEGWVIDKEKSTDTNIVLKEVEKPIERWRDNPCNRISGYAIDVQCNVRPVVSTYSNTRPNYNIFATEKQAKSALAMARISQIMANDERFGGVVTDEEWLNGSQEKCCLIQNGTISGKHLITINSLFTSRQFLAFHTKEQATLFGKENLDLIADYFMINYEDIYKE